MKIPLKMGTDHSSTSHLKISEQEILAAKRGDWTAKGNLAKAFSPLLTNLAHKRASDPTQVGELLEAGKEGLFRAARKYAPSVGAAKFQVFALDFIETDMNHALKKGKGGFLARLFGWRR